MATFIGEDTFFVELDCYLKPSPDVRPQVIKWWKTTWFKWFQQQPELGFDKLFKKVVKREPSIVFEGFGASADFFFAGSTRLSHLSKYQVSDVERGLLWHFQPECQLHYWLGKYEHAGLSLIEIRDYLTQVLRKQPHIVLGKFSVDSLPQRIKDWREEQDRLRQLETKLTWDVLTRDVDYWVVGMSKNKKWTLVRLCTEAALKYESQRMHHCIEDYAQDLYQTPGLVLMSLRPSDALGEPHVSIEARFDKKKERPFELIQFKGVGNSRIDPQSEQCLAYIQIMDIALATNEQAFRRLIPHSLLHLVR